MMSYERTVGMVQNFCDGFVKRVCDCLWKDESGWRIGHDTAYVSQDAVSSLVGADVEECVEALKKLQELQLARAHDGGRWSRVQY